MPDVPAVDPKRAIVLAGHRGDAMSARRALRHGRADVRAAALGALQRCEALTVDDLRHAVADDSSNVRARCAMVLAATDRLIAAASRAELILALLHDVEHTVTESACFAAGELEDATADIVEALVRIATEHTDPLCRESAVAALGSLGDPAGFVAVAAGCRDVPAVRRRAVLALVAFDDPQADDLLNELSHDRDWQVRQAAEDLVATDATEAGRSGPAPESRR